MRHVWEVCQEQPRGELWRGATGSAGPAPFSEVCGALVMFQISQVQQHELHVHDLSTPCGHRRRFAQDPLSVDEKLRLREIKGHTGLVAELGL